MSFRGTFFAIVALCVTSHGIALPSKGKVKAGEVSIKTTGKEAQIVQATDRAIVHFEDFSIGKNESVFISQPSTTSALLNRVTGSFPSEIDGALSANGRVYLINPKGVIVGPTGTIKTAEFIASTLEIADREFLEQNSFHFKGDSTGKIVHMGTIVALEGDVSLFARTIEQTGDILAKQGDIHLISGSEVFLSPGKNCLIQPEIRADSLQEEIHSAGGSAYSLAINHEGIIESTIFCAGGINGSKIAIQGDNIHLRETAKIDVSKDFGGGEIHIGSGLSTVHVDLGARIYANAKECGDGGTVMVLGKDTYFSGTIESRGGNRGGDGGFVEVSGYKELKYYGKTDTRAPNGKTGTLLLDPSDITINSTGASLPILLPATPPLTTYNPSSPSAVLKSGDIKTVLDTSNLTISTNAGSGGNGTITWAAGADISWSAPTKLLLTGDGPISLGSDITNVGSGSFEAFGHGSSIAGTPAGVTVGPGVKISVADGTIFLRGSGGFLGGSNYGVNILGSVESTSTGSITIFGEGGTPSIGSDGHLGVRVAGAINAVDTGPIFIKGLGGGSDDNNHGVSITGTGSITSSGTSPIIVTGIGGTADDSNYGVYVLGPITSSGTAPISITGTSGGGSAGSDDNYGVFISGTSITSVDGAIEITGNPTPPSGRSRNHGIRIVSAGKVISTGSATISLMGTGVTGTGGSNRGISFESGEISSVSGVISMIGKGGDAASSNYGVLLSGEVTSLSSAPIRITGTGGVGDDNNTGVRIASASGIVSSFDSGTITIMGTGQGSTPTADDNFGVQITSGSKVTSVNGAIGITGIGTSTGVTADSNHGISIDSSGVISSTGTATISLTGTGASGGGGSNRGVFITGIGTEINSVNGDISITGAGGAAGSSNVGVQVSTGAEINSTGIAAVTILGTGGAGAANNDGIELTGGSKINSSDGSISLTGVGAGSGSTCHGISMASGGTAINYGGGSSGTILLDGTGAGSSGDGIDMTGTLGIIASSPCPKRVILNGTVLGSGQGLDLADPVGGPNATGDLTFTTETIDIGGASIQTTGAILFQPESPSTSIGLGGGAGIFNLSDTELNTILPGASNLTFGRDGGTSTITMDDYTSGGGFKSPVVFRNNTFALTGDISTTASHDITIIADTLSAFPVGDTITTSGRITFKPQTPSRQINIGGTAVANSLSITSSDLANLTSSELVFGDALQTGAADLRAYTYTVPVKVYSDTITTSGVVSGSDLTLKVGFSGNNGIANIRIQPIATTTIEGGTGINTLNGRISGSFWSVDSSGGGTLNGNVSFLNIQNLVGVDSGPDTFSFTNSGSITGTIDGVSVSGNTLDYTLHTDPVFVDLETETATGMSGFSKIEIFTGGPIASTLIGKNKPNTWVITSEDAGTVAETTFSSFQNLTGGTFTNAFSFSDGASFSGTINGGSSNGNSFDFSAFTADVSINLSNGTSTGGNFENIQSFRGGSSSNTITGPRNPSSWWLSGNGNGTINNSIAFTLFDTLIGGNISDTLRGPNSSNIWEITSDNGGTVAGTFFSNIGSLTGGTGLDTFIFSDQVNLLGSVQGGGTASQNTLDYRLFTLPVLIKRDTLTSGTSSNLGGGFRDIGFIIGNTATLKEIFILDRSFISIIGVAVAGVNSFQSFFDPRTIQYRQFSVLNRIATLPLESQKIAYAPGVLGEQE